MENENIRENENLNEETVEETMAEEVVVDETVDEASVEETVEEAGAEDDIFDYHCQEDETEVVEDVAENALTPEELAIISAAKKKRRNMWLAISAVVIVIAALAAYWVCRVEGIGEKTIVSNDLLPGDDTMHDNIKYENPVMALINSFNDKKDAVMTIDGMAVDKDIFEYMTNVVGANCVNALMQTGIIDDLSKMKWDDKAFEDNDALETEVSYLEYSKGTAVKRAIPTYALIAAGEKNGIVFTEEDEKMVIEQVEGIKEAYGEDFPNALAQNGLPSEETFVKMQRLQLLLEKVSVDVEKDMSKYVSVEDLKASAGDTEIVTAKHILIAFDEEVTGDVTDEKKAAAKTEAEEVLKKLNEGGDFDKLMEEHNDDPGATPEGYTFANDGTMVQQFADAAFALEIGETSGLVETTFGYHIIQRLERQFTVNDYMTYLSKNADAKIRKGNYAKIAVTADLNAMFGTVSE